jgi:hypothetical protein
METKKEIQFVRMILLSNGVVDLLAAIALFFPVFKIALPGYTSYTNQFAFIAGGWGIAAFTFGIGRIWASYQFEFYWLMGDPGLIRRSSSFFVFSDQYPLPGNQFIASDASLISGKCIWGFLFYCPTIPVAFGQIQLNMKQGTIVSSE